MKYTFTVPGAPRTKKTSNRIIKVGRFTKVLPSKAHEVWFKSAMTYALLIRTQLLEAGLALPIKGPVNVAAVVYREANCGDLVGYEQALADWMQTPRFKKLPGGGFDWTRTTRDGAGIIDDDEQIVSWDGSRLDKDRDNPRIEVTLEVLS